LVLVTSVIRGLRPRSGLLHLYCNRIAAHQPELERLPSAFPCHAYGSDGAVAVGDFFTFHESPGQEVETGAHLADSVFRQQEHPDLVRLVPGQASLNLLSPGTRVRFLKKAMRDQATTRETEIIE